MVIKADLHTHSLMSGHAYGTIREMALEASERGLDVLGITEHAPGIRGTCDPIYFLNLEDAPRDVYGVKLLYGSEINVLRGGRLSLEERCVEALDYGIVGIHGQCYENEGMEKNTDNLISCMRHEKVRLVSHPDDDSMPLEYERLVEAAREYDVALEVNNSSLRHPEYRLHCVENYERMLGFCERVGVPVVVSSDAHDPAYVGRFDEALALLERVRFPEGLVLNADVERMEAFLRCGMW